MKKLNITKEQFNKSKYFKNKYGKLEYVSESGKVFKTSKGKIMKFKESFNKDDFNSLPKREQPKFDIGEYVQLNRNFFYRHAHMAEIENLKPNGWEVEDVKEISGGFKYYVVNDDYFDDEDNEQEGFWVWDDEIKKDDKGRFRESTKKFGKESLNTNYKINYVDIDTSAEYGKIPLTVSVFIKGGKLKNATVQLASAEYGIDPWLRWEPGKRKIELGGDDLRMGTEELYPLAKDRNFVSWLEKIVYDIASKFS